MAVATAVALEYVGREEEKGIEAATVEAAEMVEMVATVEDSVEGMVAEMAEDSAEGM